jgi:hypothetical protein
MVGEETATKEKSVSAEKTVTRENLTSIGGKWYVSKGQPAVYYYDDAGKMLDLFSYHTKDTNKDDIPNIKLSHDEKFLIMESQGYPNHTTAIFPNSQNPNTISVQRFTFRLPLVPIKSNKITRVPMGPIGTAINGVVFYNPFEQGGMNAVAGYSEVWLDSCCGHPDQRGVYHYHKYPSCVKSPFPDDGKQHSPILGFAFDGFPLYGPYDGADVLAKDVKGDLALDVCNGHEDPQRGYHYHVTPGIFPYIIGGYHGVPEVSNSPPMRRAAEGAILDNATGTSRLDELITSVIPGNLARGNSHQITIKLDPTQIKGPPLPPSKPSWVQVGPYKGSKIERAGNSITCELKIPADANLGIMLDCHLEFEAPRGNRPFVYKQNDALRIVE